ncbi:maternal effect protein staufen isoform X2 [Drosophila montana]|uniref:maternal effect protein staufen isoform X2 n=1 Tax=Drosophila montana TaxID=40370 RepID=UPI00313F2743
MQHHVHAPRAAPHLRAAHHHGHIALPPHPGMEPHLGTLAAAASLVTQQQAPPPPPREHGRLNHHHHHHQQQQQHPQPNAAYHNSSSNNDHSSINNNQMQKIRQQHQHLNSNSNGHLTKCNQAPPPAPQAYNHLAGNPAALSYGQLPHHMTHLGSYAAQPPPAVLSGGKQQHYYLSSGKPSKYNNSNNSGSSSSYAHATKTILQNTYRHAKSNGQLPVAAMEAPVVAGATAATAAAAAEHALPSTLRLVGNCRNSNSDSIAIASDEVSEVPSAESPDNCESLKETTLTQDEDCSSSAEQLDAAGTLSNEDGSAARGSKDKTPMCLVNELARYNKITHQYRLTGERGPAHCKTFTVTLKLGEEEYSADGFKIKKAQHLAASKAIEETKYKHPPPKIRRNDEGSSTRTHITPTVELNALAMKLGQRTYYLLDPTQMPPSDAMLPPEYATPLLPTPAAGLPPPPYALRRNANAGYVLPPPPMHPHHHVAIQTQRGIYGHQRPFAPKYQSRYALAPALGPHMLAGPHGPYAAALAVTPSKITLFVGKQKFVGVGRTLQQAKHDAAARALQVLKTQSNSSADEGLDDSMDEGDKKSPISQVHEIGIKRNMTVHFKVLREEGPAHMKNFVTACIVGSIVTEGEGNGKKLSKKRAAEKMLTELQKLPPFTPTKQTPMKRIKVKTPGKGGAAAAVTGIAAAATVTPLGKPERRKRLNAPLKEKPIVELDDAENPITKLIQLQQTRKEKEPIFELIAKNGNETSRRREFVMEVSASGSIARGTGNSKKLAKRSAAQALLELLETTEQSGGDSEHALEHNLPAAAAVSVGGLTIESTGGLDVPMVSTPAGPVPGILILRQNKKPKKKDAVVVVKANVEPAKEKEAKKEAIITATVTERKSSHNSSSNNESNDHEAANESSLNTSTGSNTSGVSSNSSNAPASKSGSNASGGGDASSSAAGGSAGGGGAGGGGGGGGVHMKEQLIYLSKLLDFEVNFSDYPKGNHNEFLTIVTLSTTPPQICHGVGKSCDESQNSAARNALKILSELGLNNAKK